MNNNRGKGGGREITKKRFPSLPYVGQSSQIIKKSLTKLDENISIAFKSYNTVGDRFFSKTKNKIQITSNTDVIYQIPCYNCPRTYVGETLQHVAKRINQHRYDEAKHKKDTNKLIQNGAALAKHASEENHSFNFDKVKLLAKESKNQRGGRNIKTQNS